MNFTKTEKMQAIMSYYLYVELLIKSQGNWQVDKKVREQVKRQLSGQIFPIETKIEREIRR